MPTSFKIRGRGWIRAGSSPQVEGKERALGGDFLRWIGERSTIQNAREKKKKRKLSNGR